MKPVWQLACGLQPAFGAAFGIMGIVNCTNDSFYEAARTPSADQAIARARKLLAEGADIIDLGAESSRPGSVSIDPDCEAQRLIPVLSALKSCGAFLSVDTWHAQTARMALEQGCAIINDISAARWDPELLDVLVSWKPGYVLMHAGDRPKVMQNNPVYNNVVDDELNFFTCALNRLVAAGLPEERIVLDLGIGFGKTLAHNLSLLTSIPRFLSLGRPLLLGLSMKSMFYDLLGLELKDRACATQVATALLFTQGVFWHRVHHVAETRSSLLLAQAMQHSTKDDLSRYGL